MHSCLQKLDLHFVSSTLWLQALSMAEIVSSLPSSGGPYFWAIHLAPKKGRSPAFAGWMTGVRHPLRSAHAFVSHLLTLSPVSTMCPSLADSMVLIVHPAGRGSKWHLQHHLAAEGSCGQHFAAVQGGSISWARWPSLQALTSPWQCAAPKLSHNKYPKCVCP